MNFKFKNIISWFYNIERLLIIHFECVKISLNLVFLIFEAHFGARNHFVSVLNLGI